MERIERRVKVLDRKKILISISFGVFWIWAVFILTSILGSYAPDIVAVPITNFLSSMLGDAMWWFIVINNSLVFGIFLLFPLNISVLVTGVCAGCIIRIRGGLVGLDILPIITDLLVKPFALLEFGAFALAVSVGFYNTILQKQRYLSAYSRKQKIIFISSGICMLIVAAILEVGL